MDKELSFDELALIAGGHTAFQLLWAGVQLGLFELLSENPDLPRDQIAERLGLETQPIRILLIGLTALRLVIKESNGYRNAGIVDRLLVSSSPECMSNVLGWQYHIVYPGEMDFVESLRQNRNLGLGRFPGDEDDLYSRLSHNPGLERVFHNAMSSLSSSANAMLAREIKLDDVKHLVDAGGGDGTNAITLARVNPSLRITVFDSPTVCELAAVNIGTADLGNRVSTYPGDLFHTDFPEGIDAILFAHMLTIWSPERDTALLRRAYEALPVGGRVMIFNMMGNDTEDGPMTAALGSPYFLTIATGEGMLYTWRDYEGFLRDAGFTQAERVVLPRDHGLLIGIK